MATTIMFCAEYMYTILRNYIHVQTVAFIFCADILFKNIESGSTHTHERVVFSPCRYPEEH